MEKIKLKAVLSILIIFIAGLVAGAVLTFLLFDHEEVHFERRFFKSRRSSERDFLEYLSQELELTSEQKIAIEAVFKEGRNKFIKIEKEMKAQHEILRKENREKIMAILNEEQRRKFEEIINKIKRRRSKSRKHRR